MKKAKTLLALLLALALAMGHAACGSTAEETESPAAPLPPAVS